MLPRRLRPDHAVAGDRAGADGGLDILLNGGAKFSAWPGEGRAGLARAAGRAGMASFLERLSAGLRARRSTVALGWALGQGAPERIGVNQMTHGLVILRAAGTVLAPDSGS